LLLTTESRALASVVGQIVLVISAGVTPQKAVFDAIDLLGRLDVRRLPKGRRGSEAQLWMASCGAEDNKGNRMGCTRDRY
jgi:hypothetical protein